MASIKKVKFCKKAGCNKFAVLNGFCDAHQNMAVKYSHEAHCPETYNYKWQKVRNAYAGEHPLCEDCLKAGETTPMREVHHITPVEFGGEKYIWDNLVSLCSKCHHIRHAKINAQMIIDNQIKLIKGE